jgi:hypothetical protein
MGYVDCPPNARKGEAERCRKIGRRARCPTAGFNCAKGRQVRDSVETSLGPGAECFGVELNGD